MATPLAAVGHQIWAGALLLADYILSNPDAFSSGPVLELGAGMGLVSLVLAHVGSPAVFATDVDGEAGVLAGLQRNVAANEVVRVLACDLSEADAAPLHDTAPPAADPPSPFAWAASDHTLFTTSCTTLVASDIIYSDRLTFAFATHLPRYLRPTESGAPRQLYLALEPRVVFTVDQCAARAPARDFLFDTLEAVNADRAGWEPAAPPTGPFGPWARGFLSSVENLKREGYGRR
ncbi:hypothetical protein BDK51DRAFT_28440 [Blyttiomyces helicus]|uniref:Methyltransferase-domain-containing protein n=1 Tax=Blyttiomyces helicus TaxID=388810 RepID=A0A4P9WEG2_9FUNG|nr:hypothetical protein BDK51DRAFT_28440 [Blyttiomyces helicus]|eukprot:RKO90093.1 hypothetical protein BDK51DRAFT_28440 [Blyttiomyces helicus]